ncbi:hypothetical protein ABTK60_20175, partial [Acinetobacter baumannii]
FKISKPIRWDFANPSGTPGGDKEKSALSALIPLLSQWQSALRERGESAESEWPTDPDGSEEDDDGESDGADEEKSPAKTPADG